MKRFLACVLAAASLAVSPILYANKTYSPLPAIVLTAKTVFIENSTGDATFQHLVYMEIVRWGRFQVAESRDKADMVIAISGAGSVRAVPASESSSGYPPQAISSASNEPAVPVGLTRISIRDPKSGKSLWFSQRKTDLSKSRTGFLDSLRDAMDQQESGHKQK
jgi:hypothetical protein